MNIGVQAEWSANGRVGEFDVIVSSTDGLSAFLSDWTPFLKDAAVELEFSVKEQFASQGASGGTPWAPLAESTIKRRQRSTTTRGSQMRWIGLAKRGQRRVAQRPLGLTGEANFQILGGGPLEESFTTGGDHHIEELTRTSLSWGSGLTSGRTGYNLAVIHHFGKGHVPARPIIVRTPQLIDSLRALSTAHLQKGMAESVGMGELSQMELGFTE